MPSRSLKGQQKSVLALGATQGVAYSRKMDFHVGYPWYHRLTKIHCPPGRYIETCSNYAKRRVHRNLHMNSGPLPEATPYVQTWIAKVQCIAKVHVYSCVSKWINRQPNLHLICLWSKNSGSLIIHENVPKNGPKWGFQPFSSDWLIGSTWYCILW